VLALQRIATLTVSAASGLVRVGQELCVVADDELCLHRYGLDGTPRAVLRLFAGELPDLPKARKNAKPDLEALCELPGARLLALGSCSKPPRERGALIEGDIVTEVDLSPLVESLRDAFDRVNIEGAGVVGPHLVLLTRRTGKRGRNTLVRLDLAGVSASLASGSPCIDAAALVDIVDVELGDEVGVPYGFTDATPCAGGLLFSAAAEDTDDPVEDGACMGCFVGMLDREGRVVRHWPVTPRVKIEGVALGEDGVLYAVADADDRDVPAPLFRTELPR
jgi:hypothetical protein